MFKAKYKAHKLINVIFYIIVFLIGFYMGVMGRNIGFKEIFNKFLFIDNVSATTIYYDGDYTPHPIFGLPTPGQVNSYRQEQYIYKMFNYFITNLDLPFNFNQYPYVLTYGNSNASGTTISWYFTSSPLVGDINRFTAGSYINITYHSGNSVPNKWIIQYGNNISVSNNIYGGAYSNQEGFGSNTLDFTNYVDFIFNSNLFSNYSNFKQVCVDPQKPFTISTENLNPGYNSLRDYLWFPGSIVGLEYSTINIQAGSISPFEEYLDNYSTFLNSSQRIDDFFNNMYSPMHSSFFIPLKTDYSFIPSYSYYGWSAFEFNTFYNNGSYILPVYKFRDDFITFQLSNSGTVHGGGGRTHHDLETDNNIYNVCFYINKDFNIYELTEDEYGYYSATITTPYGDYDFYGSSTTGNSFFDTFQGDTYGLISFLQAPINALRSIANGTCTPQNISILNKDITLPCGDTIFWGREDVQDFKIFWNVFAGGLIAYGSGIYLFKSIQKIKDPSHDKIEVIDL